ncbi:MAG: 16S rRNA (adenine(1518)-N(6)/adenine(1519)-N(6))-dimethyltransferase RsmA [Solirubrobacterales bacterium]
MVTPAPSRRQRRLGQNFIADPNLLAAIVRESGLGPDDVALEFGAGGGALSERLAGHAAHLHVVEIDRRLEAELAPLDADPRVSLHWGDAMKLDLAAFVPPPGIVVSNLPYSLATALILRTIEDLPRVDRWTVMVQREIAERLSAVPDNRVYGAPSVLVQLAAEVKLTRRLGPEVFVPRPRVESALLRLRRRGPAAPEAVRELVKDAFAHRRKSLARSLELAKPGRLEAAREALLELGLPENARAEALSPEEFAALSSKLD